MEPAADNFLSPVGSNLLSGATPPHRVVAFFDGMNLFNAVKDTYGYPYPTYDPGQLAAAVCAANGWQLIETRFYVGVPEELVDPARHHFWRAKIRVMKGAGIAVESRLLRYKLDASRALVISNGFPIGREKGIDLRLGLDMLEAANNHRFDTALLFSQDQDFTEAIAAVKRVDPTLSVACAYPIESSPAPINSAKPVPFDRALYDACQDTRDYRQMIGLSEVDPARFAGKLTGLSAFWNRAQVVVPAAGGLLSGTLRGLFLITGGGAKVCVDDGHAIQVATVERPIAAALRRNLGRTIALDSFYFDGNAEWCLT